MDKKVIIISFIGLSVLLLVFGVFIYKQSFQFQAQPLPQSIGLADQVLDQSQKNQPTVKNEKNSLKSCAKNPCEKGYICYNSQFGGLGEDGKVGEGQEGDLLCHKECVSDSDCENSKCKTTEMKGGDIVYDIKFCSEK